MMPTFVVVTHDLSGENTNTNHVVVQRSIEFHDLTFGFSTYTAL